MRRRGSRRWREWCRFALWFCWYLLCRTLIYIYISTFSTIKEEDGGKIKGERDTFKLRKVTTSPNRCSAARMSRLSASVRGDGDVVMWIDWGARRVILFIESFFRFVFSSLCWFPCVVELDCGLEKFGVKTGRLEMSWHPAILDWGSGDFKVFWYTTLLYRQI